MYGETGYRKGISMICKLVGVELGLFFVCTTLSVRRCSIRGSGVNGVLALDACCFGNGLFGAILGTFVRTPGRRMLR